MYNQLGFFMEETEKKKKGRPRKQAAVTENNQETSPKEGEAKFEPQALDSENAQKITPRAPKKNKNPGTGRKRSRNIA